MSELSTNDIQRLGQLARLDLTEEEKLRFARQLSGVVSYVDQLSEADTSAVGQVRGVSGLVNILADDQIRVNGDPADVIREKLLSGTPVSRNGLIRVRAVLNDGV